MKRAFRPSRAALLLVATAVFGTLMSGAAFGVTVIPPPTQLPLNQIPVPEPPNLFQFVKSKSAAIRLGKAFYWDMQAGSDGIQACGSCHFSAGADSRLKNTVNPGFDNAFTVRGPNQTLQPSDFPFLQRQDPDTQSTVLRDSNDIVGSQGVRFTDFVNIVVGSPVDNGNPVADPIFNANGVNTRRVTNRQAPSVINAIFNFSNFWDGRAHFEFNGVNPFGTLDPNAGVWVNNTGTLAKQAIHIQFGSLASQATGPPVNETEMSYRGRTFPLLGRKMLSLTPLGKQLVHPGDSELGALSRAVQQPDGSMTGAKGLKTGYARMIQDAFVDTFWNSNQLTPDGYTQMEANFSLFWGLAIQLYEATLVSDQSPFDRFLGGDQTALTDQQKLGFTLFFGVGTCGGCHTGAEVTSASVTASAFLTNASHALIEPMPVVSGQQVIYDAGFNNTAVRPTTEDICRGADSPFTNPLTGLPFPLSFSALAELQAIGKLGFNASLFPLGSPLTPILPAIIPANFPVANSGAFKVPSLRNIELTPPYFHNGGVMTLEDVVHFYVRGGDFRLQNQDDVDVLIAGIPALVHDPVQQGNLVAFLKSFTDERVRNESAPFDHPEILIPQGDPEVPMRVPARDEFGLAAPSLPTVTLDAVTTPTLSASRRIGGTKEYGAAVTVALNGGQAFPADTVTDTTWSTLVPGLAPGANSIAVTATDVAGGVTTLSTSIFLTPVQPIGTIAINGGAALTNSLNATLTLSATGQNQITQMQFSKDGVNYFAWETYATGRAATLPAGDGVKTMYVRYKDSAGLVSQVYSDTILLDTTLPTGSIAIDGGAAFANGTTAVLTLSASDLNGVTGMQFSKDGGLTYYPMETFATTRSVTLSGPDGLKTVTVRFRDAAGNLSAPVSASITLATAPPTGSVAINGGATFANVPGAVLALSASAAVGTVTQMQLSWDGVSYYPLEPYAATRNLNLSAVPGDGLKTIRVRFKDSNGNLSAPASASITLDATAPSGSIAFLTPDPTTLSTGTLAVSASDATSGVTQMQFAKNGSGYFAWETYATSRTVSLSPGLNTLTVRFRDAAGNISAPFSTTITRN